MALTDAKPSQTEHSNADQRPRFGIGHVSMTAADIATITAFYGQIGMRIVVETDHFAILELRGGTHIVVHTGQAGDAILDLIVDDIDETHRVLAVAGAQPTRITRGSPHDRFQATDPEGNALAVSSNHAIGPV